MRWFSPHITPATSISERTDLDTQATSVSGRSDLARSTPVHKKQEPVSYDNSPRQNTPTGKSIAYRLRQQIAQSRGMNKERKESNKISARTLAELDTRQVSKLASMLGVSSTDTNYQKEKIAEYFDKFNALQRGSIGGRHDLEIKNCNYRPCLYPGLAEPTSSDETAEYDKFLCEKLSLSPDQASRLRSASKKLDMHISVNEDVEPAELAIYFNGSFTDESRINRWKDGVKHAGHVVGKAGEDSRTINEVAQIFSESLPKNPNLRA